MSRCLSHVLLDSAKCVTNEQCAVRQNVCAPSKPHFLEFLESGNVSKENEFHPLTVSKSESLHKQSPSHFRHSSSSILA